MPRKTVLLDLDGTVLHTEPGIFASLRLALDELGIVHPEDVVSDAALRQWIGPPLEVAWTHLAADRVREGVDAYRRHYDASGKLGAEPYDGIPEALEALSADHDLVVATSKRGVFADQMVDHFGLRPWITEVFGAPDSRPEETKPELLARILDTRSLDPADAVMVGDREYDILGAKANGVASIGVLWGFGSSDELTAAGATVFCATPRELPGVVGSVFGR